MHLWKVRKSAVALMQRMPGPRQPQPFKSLGTGHFVDKLQVDIEHRRLTGRSINNKPRVSRNINNRQRTNKRNNSRLKAGRSIKDLDLPELLVCCLSDKDPQAAMAEGKKLVAYYLATEPHIMKASGVSEELLEKIQSILTWPAREEDYIRAAREIPDEVVRNLMAVGTSNECRAKVKEYIDTGVTCPILFPMMPEIEPVIDAFADGL